MKLLLIAVAISAVAGPVAAHVSEGGLVLLLPTGFYISAGAWAVALTVAALALVPAPWGEALFRPAAEVSGAPPLTVADLTSLAATLVFAGLLYAGIAGSRDPLVNPLPLAVWTLIWMVLMLLQGVCGDLWRWLNPWSGVYALLLSDIRPPLSAERLGQWPAALGLLLFASFAFADPAPDDPARLALVAAGYWLITLIAMALFGGEAWLARGEFLTVMLRLFADMAPIRWREGRCALGLPGWRLFERGPVAVSAGVFALLSLGVGSFDGLNETFWWLGVIGVNPLEFPGRSAIIAETLGGLWLANLALVASFAAAVWIGARLAALAGGSAAFWPLFAALALAVTPIALGYHLAHYLTSILVNMQYAVLSASDPMGSGADYLGLGVFYVSTGFFNRLDTVEMIFTTQALAVVIGHMLSVLLAHAIAMRAYGDWRCATLSQLPLACFMIGYTFLGLWLLAAPKGA